MRRGRLVGSLKRFATELAVVIVRSVCSCWVRVCTQADTTHFYTEWVELWGSAHNINFSLVVQTIPQIMAMVRLWGKLTLYVLWVDQAVLLSQLIIVVISLLLQLAGTERSLQVDLDFDDETLLGGFVCVSVL